MYLLKLAFAGCEERRLVDAFSMSGAIRSVEMALGHGDFRVMGGVPVRSGVVGKPLYAKGGRSPTDLAVLVHRVLRVSVESRKLFDRLRGMEGEEIVYHVGRTGKMEKVYPLSEVMGRPVTESV